MSNDENKYKVFACMQSLIFHLLNGFLEKELQITLKISLAIFLIQRFGKKIHMKLLKKRFCNKDGTQVRRQNWPISTLQLQVKV